MRKKIALFLATLMCVSLCACGNTDKSTEIRIEEDYTLENGDTKDVVIFISKKELKKHLKKVTLTKDNWKEYFGDYEYTEHIVETNTFGDVENEYDVVHKGFGGKKIVALNGVAFKFASYKTINEDGTESYVYAEEGEYFLEEMEYSSNRNRDNKMYGESECIDVIGEIIVLDLDINTLEGPSFAFCTPEGKHYMRGGPLGSSNMFDVFNKYFD